MPGATVREESEYRLPNDVIFTGRLDGVKEKSIKFTYKDTHAAVKNGRKKAGEEGQIDKWVWQFTILNEGEFYGKDVELETEPGITMRTDDMCRLAFQALLGRDVELGEDLHTDQVTGLQCRFDILHEPGRERSDGKGTFYGVSIANIYPLANDSDVPPF